MNATDLRAQLDHPIVDADGHLIEYLPVLRDFIVEEAGEPVGARFDEYMFVSSNTNRTVPRSAPREDRLARRAWWSFPAANTLDRATATFPNLMYERLDELGIDFAVTYPTYGLFPGRILDDELRLAFARGCNRYYTEVVFDHRDRMEPVASIPMRTPEEAIAELDFAVEERGMKAIVMDGLILRPIKGAEGIPTARWVDTVAHDSLFDYDPVWRRCAELGVNPTFHTIGQPWGTHASTTNFVFNHIGHFATAQETICRAIVMGGVAKRFPELRFSFLEGGCAWAANLCSDLISHFEKRNKEAVQQYNPARVDREEFRNLLLSYGGPRAKAKIDEIEYYMNDFAAFDPGEDEQDEFAESRISSEEDIINMFTGQFFFGCEADDPMTSVAFDPKLPPRGQELQPLFASDVGHFDVPDMRAVLHEAWELVEQGLIDGDQFRQFTFANAARFWTSGNPGFFHRTHVEGAVDNLMAAESV